MENNKVHKLNVTFQQNILAQKQRQDNEKIDWNHPTKESYQDQLNTTSMILQFLYDKDNNLKISRWLLQ